jgi:hypothetical protein
MTSIVYLFPCCTKLSDEPLYRTGVSPEIFSASRKNAKNSLLRIIRQAT